MSKSNTKTALPWWVELLFVQIGLPDSLLRSFLINKKKTRNFYSSNRRPISIIFIASLILVYIQPLVKQASIHNQCINDSKSIVEDIYDKNNMLTQKEIRAVATNFCNGGGL